jgi:hypothetical protein
VVEEAEAVEAEVEAEAEPDELTFCLSDWHHTASQAAALRHGERKNTPLGFPGGRAI